MSGALSKLDEPCPVCNRVSGEHTLFEWNECLGTVTEQLPYQPLERDAVAEAAGDAIRRQFQLDRDLIVADHVIAKAITLAGEVGSPVTLRLPGVIHEFAIGVPGKQPKVVAKVIYLGDQDGIADYGRLVHDTARGAVRAARQGDAGA